MIYVIVAGGNVDVDFTGGFIKGFDESSLFIVACDKGYLACEKMGITPKLLVGDFDSAGESVCERAQAAGVAVQRLNPIKDDTDTEAALNQVFDKASKDDEIYLFGATGTRLDHVLGNIALLGKGLRRGYNIKLVDSNNYIELIEAGREYNISRVGQFGRFVSVYPFMGIVSGLSMKGFKYPLEDAEIDGFSTLTISNEITGEEGVISIEKGYLIVMQTRD